MDRRHFLIVFFAFTAFMPFRHVLGQEVIVRGQFLVDSIKIGSIFPYALSVYYPESVDVLFPDSTYSFDSFEFDHKHSFPTRTHDGISYDSAVYFLSSFEIDSVQQLRLPIFVVNDNDSTVVYADKDSVSLIFLVDHVPDMIPAQKLSLKTNTTYRGVKYFLNYPFFLALGGGIIVALLVFWVLFKHRIRRYFLLKKLNKRHARFLLHFDGLIQQIKLHHTKERVEELLITWKQYLEFLLGKPFTKYTSKEVFEIVQDRSLYGVLQKIDYDIHGATIHEKIEEHVLLNLKYFAEDSFSKKIIDIKNG